MIQRATASTPIPLPLTDNGTEDDDVDIVLLQAGDLLQSGQIESLRALIVADHGLELLRRLIRRGCLTAMSVRPAARLEAGVYGLALFPDLTPWSLLERVIPDGRRALMPGGRLVACMSADPNGHATLGLARRLKLNGFVDVRTIRLLGRSLVRADRAEERTSSHQHNRAHSSGAVEICGSLS